MHSPVPKADRSESRSTLPPSIYRPDIDGLRAISILLVLGSHSWPAFVPGGFIGVDIFFVISGFLITGIILRQDAEGSFSLSKFYARRVRRIFPALIVVMSVTYAIGWAILLPSDFISLGENMVAGAMFASNLLQLKAVNYFAAGAAYNPLLHIWSLGVEEQFYIFWPLALLLVKGRRSLIVAIAVITTASFALSVVQVIGRQEQIAFFSPLSRAWELMAGAALAAIHIRKATAFSVPGNLKAAIGFGLITVGALMIDKSSRFPGWNALFPVIGAVLLLDAPNASIAAMLRARPMVAIGLISYPLYLWHWPLLSFLATIRSGSPTELEIAGTLCAAFGLAWATYRWIETPIKQSPSAIGYLSAGLVAAGLAGIATVWDNGMSWRFPIEVRDIASLRPATNPGFRKACFLPPEEGPAAFGPSCIEEGGKPLIMLWGDSTAAALYPGLQSIQQAGSFRIAQFTASSCPPILGLEVSERRSCPEINAHVLQLVAEAHPTTVLLHALWDTDQDLKGLVDTLAALRALQVPRIVIVGPVPMWKRGLPETILSYYRVHHIIPTRISKGVSGIDRDEKMRSLAAKLGVTYISAWHTLCDHHGCVASTDATPAGITTLDTAHLSAAGAEFLMRANRGPLLDNDR
ncbi:acyltransferase family protein [Tardiphaga sp. 11_C7_N12_6]|uniref:acyltransferase family protein n=1 Tax=Tardiphaga sp. 11_C7_N12_6 TaxID=3240789 RepID=UPI003F264E1F